MKLAPFFSIGALAAISLFGCSGQSDNSSEVALNQEVTVLRFSHFYPATADVNKEIFEPWAKKIGEDSNGRLKVEVYPSATLSKADTAYESTVKGTILSKVWGPLLWVCLPMIYIRLYSAVWLMD